MSEYGDEGIDDEDKKRKTNENNNNDERLNSDHDWEPIMEPKNIIVNIDDGWEPVDPYMDKIMLNKSKSKEKKFINENKTRDNESKKKLKHELEERYVIDPNELKLIFDEVIERKPNISSYTKIGNTLGIGSNIFKAIEGNLSFSKINFNKLQNMIGRKIPHKIYIGHHEKIILEKNGDTAELVGIILGDGNTTYSKGYYRLDIALNGVQEWSYVEFVKYYLQIIFKMEPKLNWLKDLKGAKGTEEGVNLQLTNAAVVKSLIDIGIIPGGKTKNKVSVPKWIMANDIFKIRCLKGLLDTDGCIFINLPDKSIRIAFVNASRPLVNDFKDMCNSIDIRTSEVHGPYLIKDPRTRNNNIIYSVRIDAKDQVNRFITLTNPMKWQIKRIILGEKLKKLYPTTNTIDEAIEAALSYKRAFYSKEYAEYLKRLIIEQGGYRNALGYLNKQGFKVTPARRTMSKFLKQLFNENDYKNKYGIHAYEEWLKYNSNIIFDEKQNRLKRFPFELKKTFSLIILKILQNKNTNPSLKKDHQIIRQLRGIINNTDLMGNLKINQPKKGELIDGSLKLIENFKVLRYERLSFLFDNKKTSEETTNYFLSLIHFVRKIIIKHNSNKEIKISKLHDEFKMLGEQDVIKDLIKIINREIIRK